MMSKLSIEGIDCYAHHGCLKEETAIGCNFRVDVVFEADFSKAVESDDLSQTIDYVQVHDMVRAQMELPSRLIEHVCGRIARILLPLLPGPGTVSVTVIKYNPPVNGQVEKTCFSLKITNNQ